MPITHGYYKEFELPSEISLPGSVKATLGKLWKKRYKDLYEKDGEDLEKAFEELFNLLSPEIDSTGHMRCVYLTWALALAARPMVLAYLPDDPRPAMVIDLAECWVAAPELIVVCEEQDLFKDLGNVSYPQALDEALLVYRNLLQILTAYADYRSIVLDVLDTCFRGYAIFPPPPDGTRDLFNWLLVEVIPAAYCCALPRKIYDKNWPWPPKENHFT